MATIDKLALREGIENALYFEEGFRHAMESHMASLRVAPGTSSRAISPVMADVWEGDLFGFLAAIGIPLEIHWVIMRLNNIYFPHDFGPKTTHLLVPKESDISRILTAYRSRKNLQM